jgi:hypothetical protein
MRIIKPTIGGHDGSSFRELLDLWEERGYCEVVAGPPQRGASYSSDPDSPEAKCWVNEMGDILLYDFPLLDRLKNDYKMCLFSNTYAEGPKNKKWIFWPKHSRLYDELKDSLRKTLPERRYRLGFIGTPTTIQRNHLAQTWHEVCDLFHYDHNKVNHPEYLEYLSQMKYGLCLAGVGPKCLRDVELMGMGTVPVFTQGVSVDYHEPPVENEHFLYAETPQEALEKINKLTDKDWENLSNNCIEWFERNCSVEGSYNITQEIINEFSSE